MNKSLSPTARSLDELREAGYLVDVVEHWNPWARKRADLWCFADDQQLRAV